MIAILQHNLEMEHRPIPPCKCAECERLTQEADELRSEIQKTLNSIDDDLTRFVRAEVPA